MEKKCVEYESTRSNNIKVAPSNALLNGLSVDGGLFVMRDINELSIDINTLVGKNYYEIAKNILRMFLDFTDEEVEECVEKAYRDKFSSVKVAPVIKLNDGYILELFNGPTSAFKDFGLLMLPQLITKALEKTRIEDDILILTATSGDTGKAALEGFKNVDRTKIVVFYPHEKVSKVQELQMVTQEGDNLGVVAIRGNFDDAQNGVKELFADEDFKKSLKIQGLQLSSANSINVGRLIAQIVYYFAGYMQLVDSGDIKLGEKVNFVVPTGNFGNILAGYYGKLLGLPINKLVCASNSNNVLYDFITTGVYDKRREFLETISPSMDILISSNLERLLYYVSDCDNDYVAQLMNTLKTEGFYKVNDNIFAKIKENFLSGYASDIDTKEIINKVYESNNYLLDTHTGVAYKVLLELLKNNKNQLGEYKNIVLSTASPYKFSKDVCGSFGDIANGISEFIIMEKLSEMTETTIPDNLKGLDKKERLHKDVINKSEMKSYVLNVLKGLK
ncbi:threonine synthase [Fusobacterium sp. PH5-44]|uniref:threonine synthase n=1 Tax=unclassified Fusobacterium TaxID=2648384 RepID=UPI003D25AD6F